MKTYLVLALGLALFLGSAMAESNDPSQKAVQRAVFSVENLTCGACFSKIQSGLAPLKGFSGMGANLFRKLVAVDFEGPLTPEKIRETIAGLGYPATLDSVETVEAKQSFAYLQTQRQGSRGGGGCCGGGNAAVQQCPGTGCALPPENTSAKSI